MTFFDKTLIDNFVQLIGKNDLYIYNLQTLNEKRKGRILMALKSCCLDSIGIHYLNSQYRSLNKNNEIFDLAVVTDKHIDQVTNLPNSIRGFMITQKGECHKFKDAYCINLICSQHSKGAILIALYLYCINNNPLVLSKIGLLELANSYYNAGGLCLYSKYGFEHDSSLYGDDCFRDYNNLPMIVDLVSKYKDTESCNAMLKDILLGNSKGFDRPNICNVRGDKQTRNAWSCNESNSVCKIKYSRIHCYVHDV